jgi:ParB family chromosome partitioning protein
MASHVKNNSGKEEWYTPSKYIESARVVMGSIDLDPASCEAAQTLVRAGKYYTKEDNGLVQQWSGNVWINPPYSGQKIKLFIEKLEKDISNIPQFVSLTNNATETTWGQKLIGLSNAICFSASRVKFLDEQLRPVGAPLQGQMICYKGENVDEFIKEFKKHGKLVLV